MNEDNRSGESSGENEFAVSAILNAELANNSTEKDVLDTAAAMIMECPDEFTDYEDHEESSDVVANHGDMHEMNFLYALAEFHLSRGTHKVDVYVQPLYVESGLANKSLPTGAHVLAVPKLENRPIDLRHAPSFLRANTSLDLMTDSRPQDENHFAPQSTPF